MSRERVLVCDGCAKRTQMVKAGKYYARPEGWRRLHVSGAGPAQWVFDICGPGCAARVVDTTYEEEDRAALRLVRSDQAR